MKKAVDAAKKIMIIWHKHNYIKYEYLEEGCINQKIRKKLESKKFYHYKKYLENSSGTF